MGHGPHFPIFLSLYYFPISVLCVLFVCKCVTILMAPHSFPTHNHNSAGPPLISYSQSQLCWTSTHFLLTITSLLALQSFPTPNYRHYPGPKPATQNSTFLPQYHKQCPILHKPRTVSKCAQYSATSHLPGLDCVYSQTLHQSQYLLIGFCAMLLPTGTWQQSGCLRNHPAVPLDMLHTVPLTGIQHQHLADQGFTICNVKEQ
jgi:hypothetical protein